MPYTVLARKYRSRTFDEVVGQEHVAQTLKKAIATGRVHHVYLFCGTRGVGKTSMARILAVALNDPTSESPTATPNPDTDTARAIFKGEEVDVIEIDAASNTGVENVRDLIENARYRPMHSRHKIYIIDEVHMLSKSAFNALLKIMEEPPEHVKFILATTEPEKVLPTILSRVQRFDFRNIPAAEIAEHLKAVSKQEGIKAEADALRLVARNGAGSMRDALSLLDRLISGLDAGETLSTDKVATLLGLPPIERVFDLAEAIGEGDPKAALARAEAILSAGQSADSLIGALIDHLHALLVRSLAGGGELSELPGLDDAAVAQQAGKFEPAVLSQDIAVLEELRRQMRSSSAGRALLDATLVRLALASQFTPVADLLAAADGAPLPARAEKKTSRVTGRPAEARAVDATPTRSTGFQPVSSPALSATEFQQDAEPPGSVRDLANLWSRLRNALQAHKQALNALLEGGWIQRIDLPASAADAGAVEIAFDAHNAPLASILERNGKKEQIADALRELLGLARVPDVRLRIAAAVEKDAISAPANEQRSRRTSEARPPRGSANESPARESPPQPLASLSDIDIEADPLVAAAIRELGARIVKVEDQ